MIDDSELTRRFSKAVPARLDPPTRDALDEMVRSVSRGSRPRFSSRRTKWLSIVGGLSVIAIGAGALPATADAVRSFMAYSVDQTGRGGTETIPNSRWIDTSQSDVAELVQSKYPESLPLPTGVLRSDVESTVAYSITQMGGVTQDVAIDVAYESYLFCRWTDVWLESDAQGKSSTRDAAAKVLADAVQWPAFVAVDADGSVTAMRKQHGADAAAGNRAGVQQAFLGEGCADWQTMGARQ